MVSIAGSNIWSRVKAGEPRTYKSLRVIPFTGPSRDEPAYRLFDKGAADAVRIMEVDEGGTVPTLRVKNSLDARVLLVDGEELIGAKQNRVLNTDVLVAAGAEILIPVSCVEAGRWGYRARTFSSGKFLHRKTRSSKSSDILASLVDNKGHVSDQSAVWNEIDILSRKLRSPSPTAAMHDVYEQRAQDLENIRAGLELPPQTLGVAVYDGDRFLGLDLFDRAATFAHYWKALLDSYALDWLAMHASSTSAEGAPVEVDQVVERLTAADWQRFDAPGEGGDVRWQDDEFTASALMWDDGEILHLQAFSREKA